MAIARPVTRTTISTTGWGIPITDEVNRLTDANARYGGHWRRQAAQAIATGGSPTTVQWDAELGDTNSLAVPPFTVLTMPSGADGIYGVSAAGYLGGEASQISITISNMSGLSGLSGRGNGQNGWASVSIAGWPLLAGTTISVQVWQNTGAAVNFNGIFSVYRMSI